MSHESRSCRSLQTSPNLSRNFPQHQRSIHPKLSVHLPIPSRCRPYNRCLNQHHLQVPRPHRPRPPLAVSPLPPQLRFRHPAVLRLPRREAYLTDCCFCWLHECSVGQQTAARFAGGRPHHRPPGCSHSLVLERPGNSLTSNLEALGRLKETRRWCPNRAPVQPNFLNPGRWSQHSSPRRQPPQQFPPRHPQHAARPS